MEYVLGIDVGGTTIKLGLFSAEGELLSEQKVKTPALDNEGGYQTVTDAIKLIVHGQKASRNDVIACGLDIPGPVADDGTVGLLANVDIDPEGLVQAINMCLPNATIAFVNDANAAALGEAWAGVAVGVPSFVLIALGTGVGAGVVVDGKLAAGAFGAGGEIGHIIVEPEETLTCGCGRHGCLEQYASAKGVVRLYLEECVSRGVIPVNVEHETDTVSVFRAHAQGDECATLAIHKMCHYLGLAMAQVSCVVDPAMFLIGGGVAGSFATFATELRECFEQYALPVSKGARIEAASLGNQAAMYGCAYEALRLRQERFGKESAE